MVVVAGDEGCGKLHSQHHGAYRHHGQEAQAGDGQPAAAALAALGNEQLRLPHAGMLLLCMYSSVCRDLGNPTDMDCTVWMAVMGCCSRDHMSRVLEYALPVLQELCCNLTHSLAAHDRKTSRLRASMAQ